MLYPYIGVQTASVFTAKRVVRITIETNEATQESRLFLDGIAVDRIYPSPIAAYIDTVRIFGLHGSDVSLEIDVAINVASLGAIEQAYHQAGVNVIHVIPT